jgi:hypothetical protein
MQISTTRTAVPFQNRAPQAEQGQEQDKQGQKNPPQEGTLSNQIIDSLVTSPDFAKKALSKMGSGSSMTINVNGSDVVTIKNEGPSLAQKVLDGGATIMAQASQEVVRVMNADPAFAFKQTARAAQEGVLNNLDSNVKKTIDPFILPVLRTGMLGMDSKRAIGTYRNKDASVWEKAVDIGHVATDVVGLAGAVGGAGWVPFLAPYSNTMTGIGLVGDLAAVTFHAMGYLTERGQVNLDSFDQIFSGSAAKRNAEIAAREGQKPGDDSTQVSITQ